MAGRRRSEAARPQERRKALATRVPEDHHAAAAAGVIAAASVVVGRLLPGGTATSPLVDFSGNVQGPVRARTAMVMDAAMIDRAVATGQGALLVFENGDPRLPIVAGLIWSGQASTPFQELLIAPRATPAATAPEARLDGERVVLEGKREVVLKCGEASITLRSDGKLVL